MNSRLDPIAPPKQTSLTQEHRVRFADEPGATHHVRVWVDFKFAAADPSGEPGRGELLGLEATFQLLYELPPQVEYAKTSVEHFAWLNGSHNAWPYWRELVQTVSGRTGLSGITIPVHRPDIKEVPDDPTPIKQGTLVPSSRDPEAS